MKNIEVVIPNPKAIYKAITVPFVDQSGEANIQNWLMGPGKHVEDREELTTHLSRTPLDGALLLAETTKVNLRKVDQDWATWKGVVSDFESTLLVVDRDLNPMLFSREKVERIKELMFCRGFTSQLREKKWLTPVQKRKNRMMYDLVSDDPELLRLFSSPLKANHVFYDLDIPRSNEVVTSVSFNQVAYFPSERATYKTWGSSVVSVEMRVQALREDPNKPARYANDQGKEIVIESAQHLPWMIELGENTGDVYARVVNNNFDEVVTIQDESVFARNLGYYAEVYQALLRSLYEEGVLDFSATVKLDPMFC